VAFSLGKETSFPPWENLFC